MRPLLSLCMIVKDEAASIRRVLETAKPFIDQWVILDTGSMDGTQGIVREVMEGVPGALCEELFVDFATSRNRVLDLHAEKDNASEFTLMLSGDEYLFGGAALRQYLETQRETDVHCHNMRVLLDDTNMPQSRVFRTGSLWRYERKIHEYAAWKGEGEAFVGKVPEAMIEHIAEDPEKRLLNILETHIPLFEEELAEDPNDPHALFYLAQSYEQMFSAMGSERITYAMKAMSLYMRRLLLPIGEIQRNFIRMKFLDVSRWAGVFTKQELLNRCVELANEDPHRPETALLLINAAINVLPITDVYNLAVHATKVAAEAAQLTDVESPVSTACGWKAHLLAANAAKTIAASYPKARAVEPDGKTFRELMHYHVTEGIRAGGSWEVFKLVTMAEPELPPLVEPVPAELVLSPESAL